MNYELHTAIPLSYVPSAQNGNLEVLVYFLKVKQVRKMERDKWI
jgi:hypothetical protein